MSRDAFGNYSLQCLYCTYTSTCWGPIRKHREEKHEDVKKASAKRHSCSHIHVLPKIHDSASEHCPNPQGGIERCIEVCTVLGENSCSWTTKSHCSNPGVEGKGGEPLLIKMILVKCMTLNQAVLRVFPGPLNHSPLCRPLKRRSTMQTRLAPGTQGAIDMQTPWKQTGNVSKLRTPKFLAKAFILTGNWQI